MNAQLRYLLACHERPDSRAARYAKLHDLAREMTRAERAELRDFLQRDSHLRMVSASTDIGREYHRNRLNDLLSGRSRVGPLDRADKLDPSAGPDVGAAVASAPPAAIARLLGEVFAEDDGPLYRDVGGNPHK